MSEDLKSSAHIWDGRPAAPEDSPPAYISASSAPGEVNLPERSNSSVATRIQQRSVQRVPYDPLRSASVLASIPWSKYNIIDGTLSKDKTTVIVKQKDLFSQPRHLIHFLLEQTRLPPRPILRIVGRRENAIDFDISLNLTHLLDIQNYQFDLRSAQTSPLQTIQRSLRANDDPSISSHITSVAKRFCNDRMENKSLTLTRSVEGIPEDMLTGQVRNLAAAIKYRGVLEIDFVYERSTVKIHQEPSGWFTSLLRLHPEQKYEVLESTWTLGDGSGQYENSTASDVGLRVGNEWWASWNSTIRNAMIRKHKGIVGLEDWIEARMGHTEKEPTQEWGQTFTSSRDY